MNPLFLIRVPVAMNQLARCAGERGWLRHRGSVAGFDEGRALHHLLDETFGPGALRPFRLLVAARQTVGSLYGYCENEAESLREGARIHALPEHLRVLKLERLESKAMPDAWVEGRRLGFDVRVRPVRRLKNDVAGSQTALRRGAELDAFHVEALRRHPDKPDGMEQDGQTRETVYLDWLAERFGSAAELDREATRLVRFQRLRVSRGNAGPEGPDATFHGALTVTDPEQFKTLLAKGVGRHRAYGFGMLLLRPASRPALGR
ncbi:MAG: type I-E CRISPR-associated protein Cas6/Cse3/CasE [Deltaproteobacteria bacterium]|nr:type I-E CRISPR-associated protein Cas6/Cse3/CasE [Deltaproteobacteria bacterium]